MGTRHKIFLGLAAAFGAFVLWRAWNWRLYYTSGTLTPWPESFRLALTNLGVDPRTRHAGEVATAPNLQATAGAGNGTSGPTLVTQVPLEHVVTITSGEQLLSFLGGR